MFSHLQHFSVWCSLLWLWYIYITTIKKRTTSVKLSCVAFGCGSVWPVLNKKTPWKMSKSSIRLVKIRLKVTKWSYTWNIVVTFVKHQLTEIFCLVNILRTSCKLCYLKCQTIVNLFQSTVRTSQVNGTIKYLI